MRQPLKQFFRRLSLRQQMMALMGAFILAASLLAGITYYQLQKQELTRYQRDDLHATLLRAEDLLTSPAANLRSDLMLLARLRATRTLMAGQCSMNGSEPIPGEGCPALESLRQAFEALVQTHQGYVRARLIGMGDEARVLLHVERNAGDSRRVAPTEVPPDDEHGAAEDAIHLMDGTLALALAAPSGNTVTLRAILPLFAPDGSPFGQIVIDLDFAPALDAVRNLASRGGKLYLATRDGRILPEQAHAAQAPAYLRDSLPKLASWLERDAQDYFDAGPDLTAARRIKLSKDRITPELVVAVSYPASSIVGELRKALALSALVTLLLLAGGILLASLMTRGFTRDLKQLARVARRLAQGDITPAVPQTGSHDIRILGEAFASMREAVVEQATSLREQEEYLRTIIETSTEGIITTDERGVMQTVNPVAARMFGYGVREMLGKNVSMLMPSNYAEHHSYFMAGFGSRHKNGPLIGRTVMGQRKDGSTFPIAIGLATFELKGMRRFAAFIQDISELQAAEDAIRQAREIESLAYYDPLTNLPNRRLLRERLGKQLGQMTAYGKKLAVALIDLDGFKEVNDRMGHEAGDQLLKHIARRLTGNLRDSDIVSRLGGDEFALILSGVTHGDDLQRPMSALLKSIADPVDISGEAVRVSASIGISLFPEDGGDIDTLLRKADIAMYRAKGLGRNRYLMFSPEMEQRIVQRHDLLTRLEQAIDGGEMELYFQPQVDMISGEVVGAEALIRWNSPEHGLRLPDEFIPLAEESGLIVRLGRWVICAALHQLEAWNRQGLRVKLGINVAARQFQDPHFVEQLGQLLGMHHEVDPGQIVLEITETAAMADLQHAREVMRACQAMGIGFSLDDFGTGFSSLTYLQQLPVQSLKIDRSFVRDILEDANDAAIAKGIIDMARLLNLPVVAEGVDGSPLANRLLEFGCRIGQGFGITPPLPAEALPSWILAWERPREWKTHVRPVGEDRHFGLQFARQAHESWIEHLLHWVEAVPSENEAAPHGLPLDTTACAFGRWCQGPGKDLYGRHPSFTRLHDAHHAVHDVANVMIGLMQEGQREAARARIPELLERRDALLAIIDTLRQEAG